MKGIKREISLPASSSSFRSSDSDTDDESETNPTPKLLGKKSLPVTKRAEPTRNLKRKAESNSPESSCSGSETESPEDGRPTKRTKVTGTAKSLPITPERDHRGKRSAANTQSKPLPFLWTKCVSQSSTTLPLGRCKSMSDILQSQVFQNSLLQFEL